MDGKYLNLCISLCFLACLNIYKSKYIGRDNKHPAEHDLYSQSGTCYTECKMILTENLLPVKP
jgi:hypothetical protein